MNIINKILVVGILIFSSSSFAWYICEGDGVYHLVCKDGTDINLGYGPPQRVSSEDIKQCDSHGGLAHMVGGFLPMLGDVVEVQDSSGNVHTGIEAKNLFLKMMQSNCDQKKVNR